MEEQTCKMEAILAPLNLGSWNAVCKYILDKNGTLVKIIVCVECEIITGWQCVKFLKL